MFRYLLLIAFVATGCAPSIAPTYRDYRIPPEADASGTADADLSSQLVSALEEAGWSVVASDAANVISTERRRIDTGVLSHVDASLDLAPLNGRFVRVYVQATRRNFLGGRSKLPYLSPGLRGRALGDITDALASRGLVALDAPRERDEEATD